MEDLYKRLYLLLDYSTSTDSFYEFSLGINAFVRKSGITLINMEHFTDFLASAGIKEIRSDLATFNYFASQFNRLTASFSDWLKERCPTPIEILHREMQAEIDKETIKHCIDMLNSGTAVIGSSEYG